MRSFQVCGLYVESVLCSVWNSTDKYLGPFLMNSEDVNHLLTYDAVRLRCCETYCGCVYGIFQAQQF